TINHNGAEFMLTREVVRRERQVVRNWRVYSGTPDRVPAPRFFDARGPGGTTVTERVVAHTHPRPVPLDLSYTQPSAADLDYLQRIIRQWWQAYGANSQPFGRICWGLSAGETTVYGTGSTPGNAGPPPWLRRR